MWSFFMVRGRVGWVKCWPLWLKNFKTILKKVPKIKFGAGNKLLKPHIWSLTSFRFSGRKSQSQQKLAKKITHFTVQVSLKKPFHFTNLNSLNIIKIYSRNTAKNTFLVGVRKKHCTVPFIGTQELHSRSNWKANDSIFL